MPDTPAPETFYKLKVTAVELEHLRQFTDNQTIASALDDLDYENKWKQWQRVANLRQEFRN